MRERGAVIFHAKLLARRNNHPTHSNSVIVVSIPPSIDLVAVEEKDSDKVQYKFPIRNGRRNDCLRYEEIMTRASTTARMAYIKLNELATNKKLVRFSNQIVLQDMGATHNLTMQKGYHGELKSYDRDVLVVSMQRHVFYQERVAPASTDSRGKIVQSDRMLTVPLELVKAIWKDGSSSDLLHVALDGKIMLRADDWTIIHD